MVLLRETAIPAFIAALVLSLAGAPPAAATSATGNQNPDLTAEVSLASRGTADPNFATVGDTVDAVLAVRNNKPWSFSARLENVRVRLTLVTPSGGAYDVSATIFLLPQQTLRVPFDYTVSALYPIGPYAVTLEAFEVDDPAMPPPSSATATITFN
jgi:hypothetical protein